MFRTRRLIFRKTVIYTVIYGIIYIQGDQKVGVILMLTVQKQEKVFHKVSITYHDNVVRVRDKRWR
jgi:hypothetical protein